MKSQIAAANAPYSTPVVSTSNSNDWYVFFMYEHDGKVHKLKVRKGINKFKDLKQRKKEAEALKEATLLKLQLGWNPIADPQFKARSIVTANNSVTMNFCDAMDYALEKKRQELAEKSYKDYRNVLEITKVQAIALGYSYITVKEITRLHVLQLLERLASVRGMSNHRYNIYLGVIRSLFTTLEKWTICESNPATKIEVKEVAESDFYSAYTEEEKILISEHLSKRHYRLFVFMQVVYHTGIRPKEVLALKISDIDMKRRVIKIVPNLEEENSKTNFIRPVVIPNALYPFLKAMYFEQYPETFYMFGSPFEPGKGNRGAGSVKHPRGQRKGFNHATGVMGAMRPDYLTPSPYRASRDTVGRLWKNLIKDPEKGLGIDKCLYAAKHTGADDKILAGIDLDALRNQYGHRSKQMTERYAKQLSELYRSNIRSQAPSFVGGKIRRIA